MDVEEWQQRRARVSTIVDSNLFEYATGFLILMLLGAKRKPLKGASCTIYETLYR